MASLLWRYSSITSAIFYRSTTALISIQKDRSMHTTSCFLALRKPSRFKNERNRSRELENDWHTDLGEWTRQNQMIYPPLLEGEGKRPAEIFHGRAKIRYPEKKLFHVQHLIRNMNIDEAISKLEYINNKAAKVIQEILLEAQEIAIRDHNVEFKSNLHIVQSFSCRHSILDFPIYRAAGRPPCKGQSRFSNYYVMLREGPAPSLSPKLTALESALFYVETLRNRKIMDGL